MARKRIAKKTPAKKIKSASQSRTKGKRKEALYTADSLTVLIHGTFYSSPTALQRWVENEPGKLCHELIHRGHNVHTFYWDSFANSELERHRLRHEAAKELVRVLSNVQVSKLIIITHSHGANVATMATWPGLVSGIAPIKPNVLVMLSPAVSPTQYHHGVRYWPNVANIGVGNDHTFHNFHLNNDLVLGAQWNVDHDHTPNSINRHEDEETFAGILGHWHTTQVSTWNQNSNWYNIVSPT